MLRNITLSADDQLIARARDKASAEQSSLNVEFRKWLESYAAAQDAAAVTKFRDVLQQLGGLEPGRTFTRDEMNER
jgi:hypothetical protein